MPQSIFQRPRLGCLSKRLAMPINLISWSTWSISSCTFPLVLTTLLAYFGLRLGDHDKTDSHSDEIGETIPFTPGGVIEGGSAWEPECYKHHSEERIRELKFSKNTSNRCIMCYPKTWSNPRSISFRRFREKKWKTALQRRDHIIDYQREKPKVVWLNTKDIG